MINLYVMGVAKRNVVEVMKNNWRHDVNNKAKLQTFKQFKE